jgi:trk system potassium uptake protein TrkH
MLGHQFRAIEQTRTPPHRILFAVLFALLAASMVALEHGFTNDHIPASILGFLQIILCWCAFVAWGDLKPSKLSRKRWKSLFALIAEPIVLLIAVIEASGVPGAGELLAVGTTIALLIRVNSVLARSMSNPSILFPASFIILISISAALLKLPAATPIDQPISWIDAFFTATSAVCVTGLSVRDTAAGFTDFGQAVILGSIQLGGLGVMIFGSTLALLFGARLSHRETLTLSKALDEYPVHRITRFAWFIVLTTLLLEAAGAVILFFTLPIDPSLNGNERVWFAVFHSISAFCNAGFDITGSSMIPLRDALPTYLGIIPMIILGGIGFMVLEDAYRQVRDRIKRKTNRIRLSTHSKIVLTTTAVLLLLGAIAIFIAQADAAGEVTPQHALDALFMSTTSRTAGFTSVPMDELTSGSRFTIMLLMFVGGSPGSTAGGIKTVVFAVLILSIISTVRGREEVEVFGRALSDATVKKAGAVVAGLLGTISGAMLLLDLTEKLPFEPLLFEVISAATTTGLSLGITGDLSPVGRVVITITMFLGRVGALALLASLVGVAGKSARYKLPRDTVSLG